MAQSKAEIYRPLETGVPRFSHINIIADYGGRRAPDHAFNEVRSTLRGQLTDDQNARVDIDTQPVHKYATIETGFWIAQIGLYNAHPRLLIFSNTAPRGEDEATRNDGVTWQGDEKQPLVYAELDNGIPVFAVHAGYNLSFIKERARRIVRVNVQNTGTQFRSRDIYTQAVAAYITGDTSIISDEPIDPETIPDVPENRVATTDGYENLKTTIRKTRVPQEVLRSPFVEVIFNGRRNFALNTLVDGVKGTKGQLCVNAGSSGDKEDPYVEIVRLQQEAARDFRLKEIRDDLGPIIINPLPGVIFAEACKSV